MKTLLTLSTITLLAVMAAPTSLSAQTTTTITDLGTTAPTPGADDISYLPASTVNSNTYTNAFNGGGSFGETFTTGSTATTLKDFVLQVGYDYSNAGGNLYLPFNIELAGVSIDSETAGLVGNAIYGSGNGGDFSNHYIEFNLADTVALAANTTYSFNVGPQTGASQGTIRLAGGNDTVTGAAAFADGRNNTGDGPIPTNYVFDVGLVPATGGGTGTGGGGNPTNAPEPQTWAMLLGGLGLLAGMQRMRARS